MSDAARTPDDHLKELNAMLKDHEFMASLPAKRGKQSKFAALHANRAAALRWLLALTAYPIDEDVVQ